MSLKNLSNNEFEMRLRNLVQQERQILHLVLEHIVEADRRRLYLDRERSSLFEYLVKDLGYSESAANRRIQAARLSKAVPSLSGKIKSGAVNLSQVVELARALKQVPKISARRKQELVEQISGQSTAATQQLISKELDIALRPAEKTSVQKDESVHLQLTLTKAQYSKLMQCKDLAAALLIQQGRPTELAQVIEVMSDKMLAPQKISEPATTAAAAVTVAQKSPKSVTPKLRMQILQRDQRCQYKHSNGQICGNTFNLQIDHIQPKWAGGGQNPSNLQVLCAAHNRHRYHKQAGFI